MLMKQVTVFVLLIGAAGVGGVLGSGFGSKVNQTFLFIGGLIGGIAATYVGAVMSGRFGLVPKPEVKGTAVGAVIGFLASAATIVLALRVFDSPVGPAACTVLTGVGGLVGGKVARSLA